MPNNTKKNTAIANQNRYIYSGGIGLDEGDDGGASLASVNNANAYYKGKNTQASGYTPTTAASGESSSSNYQDAVKNGVTNSNTSSGVTSYTKTNSGGGDGGNGGSGGDNGGANDDSYVGEPKVETETKTNTYDDSALRQQISDLQDYYSSMMSMLYDKISSQDDAYAKLQDAYSTSLEEQKKAIQAGVDQSVNTLNNQKNSVNTSYDNTLRQLYIDKMNAQKNIGQQMAAAGQTGGQAESTLLGLNTNYAENLRNSEQAKSSALSELETAIANAQLSGSAETANAIANNGVNSAQAYVDAMNSYMNNGMNYASMLNTANQQNYSNADSRAMTLISNGVMPSSQVLAEANMTQAEAQSLINQVNASKSSSSSSNYKTSVADTFLDAALNSGSITAEQMAYIEAAYPGIDFNTLVKSKGYDPSGITIEGGSGNGSGSGNGNVGETEETTQQTIVNPTTPTSAAQEAEQIYKSYADSGNVTSGNNSALSYLYDQYRNGNITLTQYLKLKTKYSN